MCAQTFHGLQHFKKQSKPKAHFKQNAVFESETIEALNVITSASSNACASKMPTRVCKCSVIKQEVTCYQLMTLHCWMITPSHYYQLVAKWTGMMTSSTVLLIDNFRYNKTQ